MFRKNTAVIIALLLFAGMLMGGCFTGENKGNGNGQDGEGPVETLETVTLYFGDDQAMFLVPEVREVIKRDETMAELVVNELIKGPDADDLYKTLPPETRLLSIELEDGVAFVDFSEEIKTKHWGGSTGETFSILSLVNSLSRLDDIDMVQILIEGEVIDSLAGHYDCSEPFEPNWDLVKE
ncbi:MAG TPA: GerMN domain-containing protein [Clostridia bacterium]|nr:GerMN domain-containing protein [Clostridia bacterium]